MGIKNSCMKKRNTSNHESSTTDWKSIAWNQQTPEKQICMLHRSKLYIINLELQQLESKIQEYINKKNHNAEDVEELQNLVRSKELKTKELKMR